jgi:hypothetical protein
MDKTRRTFLAAGATALGAGALATSARAAEEEEPMIAACGLACSTCPLKKAGKCKGCASGKGASAEMLKMKPCPVLQCAAKKQIDYCGTGCKMFPDCKKLVGRPYAESFLQKVKQRLG